MSNKGSLRRHGEGRFAAWLRRNQARQNEAAFIKLCVSQWPAPENGDSTSHKTPLDSQPIGAEDAVSLQGRKP